MFCAKLVVFYGLFVQSAPVKPVYFKFITELEPLNCFKKNGVNKGAKSKVLPQAATKCVNRIESMQIQGQLIISLGMGTNESRFKKLFI